jgi:hypothetical protein
MEDEDENMLKSLIQLKTAPFYIKKERERGDQTTRCRVTVHCLLLLPERNCLGALFAGAFNA